MDCTATVKRTGNSPNGDHLTAKFNVPDFPDEVNIKGTTDTQGLRGNSGVWISGNKYGTKDHTPAVTLVLLKGGVAVKECPYDEDGNLNIPTATITNFALTSANGTVTASWLSVKEIGLALYIIDRKLQGVASWDLAVQIAFPQGSGSQYDITDTPPTSGIFDYQLRAQFGNGTEKVIASGTVTV